MADTIDYYFWINSDWAWGQDRLELLEKAIQLGRG